MSSDLDGDGRSTLLDSISDNTSEERRLAAIHIRKRALYPSDANRLLWALDLHDRPAPSKQNT